jgi:glycosyltransferase involved in cell wall biosynthesis
VSERRHVLMLWGDFTFVQDWARAASRSVDVTLAVQASVRRSRAGGRSGTAVARIPVVPIARTHLRPSRLMQPVNAAYEARQIGRALERLEAAGRRVDCLHTHFFNNAVGAVLAARRQGIPIVHTEHSSSLVASRTSPSASRMLLEVVAGSSAVFAVSDPLRRAMVALGVQTEIQVLPNPVDVSAIAARPIEARYPPAAGVLRIVTVGWLVDGKRHEDLIRMVYKIRESWPRVELHVIGDGLLEGRLRQLANQLDLADQVVFHGRLPRDGVLDVFARSHIYAHASELETYGVALVEAWASGLPVVTYDCGGVSAMAETLQGEVVGTRSPDALAAAAVRVAAGISLERREAVRQAATQHFDVRIVERTVAETYARVMR